MTTAALQDRLTKAGPKRILSLDGGGIRGAITIGFLEQIELIVQRLLGRDDAVLAEYFDLIGGTSTGAIIATLLALGHPVAKVKQQYLTLGAEVFSTRTKWARIPWIGPKLFTNWSARPLERHAVALFSEKTTLGSPSIHTGLCIVAKRADTFSTWPYINHPGGKYYADNAEIPLWKLVRASSAAPTYFQPMKIDVGAPGAPHFGVFVDGGVSMANNPAWQLFLVATLRGFPFRWKTGPEHLQLVSIGTGRWKQSLAHKQLLKSTNLYWARQVPDQLMNDASKQVELLMQYVSDSPTARQIDGEIGDLKGDLLGGAPQLAYIRYNAVLEESELASVGVEVTAKEIASLRDMSAGTNAQQLYRIGAAFASRDVSPDHFVGVPGAPSVAGSQTASITVLNGER